VYFPNDHGFSVESKVFHPIFQRGFSVESKAFHPKPDFSCDETRFSFGSRHCALVLQKQVPKLFTDLNLGLLYILILGTYSKFARKNNFLAPGVCFQQPCSSAGRRFAVFKITFTKLPTNRFVSATKDSMKCVVNCIPLRIRARSKNTKPHLNSSQPPSVPEDREGNRKCDISLS